MTKCNVLLPTQARDGHTVCMAVQHGEGQYLLMNLADSGKVHVKLYTHFSKFSEHLNNSDSVATYCGYRGNGSLGNGSRENGFLLPWQCVVVSLEMGALLSYNALLLLLLLSKCSCCYYNGNPSFELTTIKCMCIHACTFMYICR